MGNLLSGWLVPMLTAPVVLGINGLLLILVALYFLFVQRRVADAFNVPLPSMSLRCATLPD